MESIKGSVIMKFIYILVSAFALLLRRFKVFEKGLIIPEATSVIGHKTVSMLMTSKISPTPWSDH